MGTLGEDAVNAERYARRAADLALAQVADRAHVLPGAAGARPGQRDGTRLRPTGVTLVPPRTDPADPAVFAARCGKDVCGGRFDQAGGGIAGGRVARRTDIDLLVYLAELASLPEDDWQPFFEFFSPRCLDGESAARRIVWGEDCRGRRHFDAEGLVNWCLEQAIDARYPITFDAATWATDASGSVTVPVTDPHRLGDLVLADRPDRGTEIGILVGGDPAVPGEFGQVVVAEQTAVGVVRRPFSPTSWTRRQRPTAELLHDLRAGLVKATARAFAATLCRYRGRRRPWELAVPVAVLAVAAWRRRWVTEDAFINFRVVAVTRHGRQPLAFNRGERVEAATSPLWLATLVVLDATLGRFVALEWLALGAGFGLSLLGLAAATAASARLVRLLGPGRLWPAGALVLSALPPVWDYATSGLETGLTFGWLGGCQWLLARRYADSVGARPRLARPAVDWLPVVLGLGPLIRPDLALFSAAFLISQLSLSRPGLLGSTRTIGAALALPAAYQLFRMAYFAATVPNTALAKEAGRSDWRRGLAYLDNHATTYRLAVPGVLVAGWAGRWLAGSAPASDRRLAVLIGAPVAAALLHAAYIIRVGGDFMHSRLLLPATFGLFMAAAALPADAEGWALPVALAAWAAACGLRLRLPGRPPARWSGIVDERAWWQRESGHRHPVTLDDYSRVASARTGRSARQLAIQRADVLVRIDGQEHPLAPGSGVVLESITIGLGSVAAGPGVRVVDVLGLADALGSRIPADPAARIGHRKRLPPALVLARLALVGEDDDDSLPTDVGRATLEAGRQLLRRPEVARLLAATNDPLTPTRALRNIHQALALTRLRVAIDTVSGTPPAARSIVPVRHPRRPAPARMLRRWASPSS